MTRFATVRLLSAALLAVLVVGATIAAAQVAWGGVGVGTLLLALFLGLVSFGALTVVLLFDSRRRHQLLRVLSAFVSDRRNGHRRTDDEPEPRDEQREEMRRRLEYALEGLRSVVDHRPAAVGAASGVVLIDDGRSPRRTVRGAVPERRSVVQTRVPEPEPESEAGVEAPSARAVRQARLPVSPGVARGAPLVRVSVTRYRHNLDIAAAQLRLSGLRHDADRSTRRAVAARWLVRSVVLLVVPAILSYRLLADASWLGGVWDGVPSRAGLIVALALGAVGFVWTLRVTRPEQGLRHGSLTKGESHVVRSLLASEQLALRLAVGVAAPDAWRTVALTNHFPPGSELPAAGVEEALVLVEELRLVARRRGLHPFRRRLVAIVRPLLACLLPASVILLRL